MGLLSDRPSILAGLLAAWRHRRRKPRGLTVSDFDRDHGHRSRLGIRRRR